MSEETQAYDRNRTQHSTDNFRQAARISNPLQFFGIVAMACTSIFSIAAAILKDPISFKYCIHREKPEVC